MDVNSVEFYTLAFVVAMTLVGLLMSRSEKKPPSTHIVQLLTTPSDGEVRDTVTIETVQAGTVTIHRTGLTLGSEETINLVITVQEDHCTIIEKKGIKRRGRDSLPVQGQATLNCLRPGHRYRVRYESQLTSAWAQFTFDTASAEPKQVILTY